jgi:hypothetical protein
MEPHPVAAIVKNIVKVKRKDGVLYIYSRSQWSAAGAADRGEDAAQAALVVAPSQSSNEHLCEDGWRLPSLNPCVRRL